MSQEPLKPFLVALNDKDIMIRGAVASTLAESANEEITKNILRNMVNNNEEGQKLIDLLKDISEKDPEPFIQKESQRALNNILQILKQHSELPLKSIIRDDKPNTNAQTPNHEKSKTKTQQTILYAYLAGTEVTHLMDSLGVTEATEKIRANAKCKDAEVVIVPPEEWSAPMFLTASYGSIIGDLPIVRELIQDHMAKSGLPRFSEDELFRNTSELTNPATDEVFFIYKVIL